MLNSRICNIREAEGAFTTNVFFELFDLKHTFIFFLLGDALLLNNAHQLSIRISITTYSVAPESSFYLYSMYI